MEWIGNYEQITDFTNGNAGTADWCVARRDGRNFFVKKFLAPVYPSEAIGLPPERFQRRVDRFHAEESRYNRLYGALNRQNASGALIVPRAVVTYQFHICTVASYFQGNVRPEDVCRLSPWQRLVLMRTLALALIDVHRAGIVHGDLKPENTLIYQDAATGMCQLRLIDFDGSYFASDPPAAADDIGGDMAYWAPEICAKFEREQIALDERIDDFALGILLHYMWCGCLPSKPKDQTIGEYVYAGNSISIDEGKVPPAIGKLIQGLLAADPERRMSCEQAYYILGVQLERCERTIVRLARPGGARPEAERAPRPEAESGAEASFGGEADLPSVQVLCMDRRGKLLAREEYQYAGRSSIVIPAKEIRGYSPDGDESCAVRFDVRGIPDRREVVFRYRRSFARGLLTFLGCAGLIAFLAALCGNC